MRVAGPSRRVVAVRAKPLVCIFLGFARASPPMSFNGRFRSVSTDILIRPALQMGKKNLRSLVSAARRNGEEVPSFQLTFGR